MRFNVDRICELAGLGAATGGLLKEAAGAPAPAATKQPPKAAAPAPKAAAPAGAKNPVDEDDYHHSMEPDMEEGYQFEDDDGDMSGEYEGYGHLSLIHI